MTSQTDIKALASQVRAHVLRMTHVSKASHVGSCLSMIDILAVLYGRVLKVDPRNPTWPDRDRFILSKGHATAALYAILAECGFFPLEWLQSYCADGGRLPGHATARGIPGIEVSTGSLGHGLPVACGIALAGKRDARHFRTYAVLSDGELDEGSNWEAILFAPQHQLDNLVVIVDYNKIQSLGRVDQVLTLDPLADKFRAFRWETQEIDGHDLRAIEDALMQTSNRSGRPTMIIAHTVKGKGVSFMEDRVEWHYKSPDARQLELALAELEQRS
jgi:transketolase